ncbi:MAG: hypothetical protein K2X39_04075 [Silvanigrellaceae bacterium]|nr:hypothetical protein [Silvanigrellaceae bacterium]
MVYKKTIFQENQTRSFIIYNKIFIKSIFIFLSTYLIISKTINNYFYIQLVKNNNNNSVENIERGINFKKKEGLKQVKFYSKIEYYFYSLDFLFKLNKKYNYFIIEQTINKLKICIENHEQNPNISVKILKDLLKILKNKLTHRELVELKEIMHIIKTCKFQQTLQEKYENPLGRRFESEMQIELMLNPTKAMMNSVGLISQALLKIFTQIQEKGKRDFLEEFARNLSSGKNFLGFGSQVREVNFEKVEEILIQNCPDKLNQILYIHFLFAKDVMRKLGNFVEVPNKKKPTGKLLEIIREYNQGEYEDDPKAFFDEMDYDKLRLISDVKIYESALFTAEPNRGRLGKLVNEFSNQMGIMLVGQSETSLPTDSSSWVPDAKYQKVNLDSMYVRDLIENDAVYVSGPSGMVSLFLNIMEIYGNLPTIQQKQNYFAAVSAYIVAAGLHSLHEVLGPAQYGLDLIPEYQVSVPSPGVIAKPPNFHQFYQQQMSIDPEFAKKYHNAWDKLMVHYANEQKLYIH